MTNTNIFGSLKLTRILTEYIGWATLIGMDDLDRVGWEEFSAFLLYDKKISNKRSSVWAIKARFNCLKTFFKTKPFTRQSFIDFIACCKQKGNSNSTINKYIALAKNLARYLKIAEFEDMTYFREPRQKEVDALSWEELKRVAEVRLEYKTSKKGLTSDVQNDRWYCLITFLSQLGCRISEALDLTWPYLKDGIVTFVDTKNGDDRQCKITPELYQKILQLPRLSDKVFDLSDIGTVNLELKKRALKCHINKQIYPHIIRHSVATNLTLSGAQIQLVQKLLGHRDVNTTIRYSHNNLRDLEAMLYGHSELWSETLNEDLLFKKATEFLDKLVNRKYYNYSITITKKSA